MLLVGLERHANALVEAHAQQIVDDLETLRPVRVVDTAQIAQQIEAAFRVVAQKAENRTKSSRLIRQVQFAMTDFARQHRAGQGAERCSARAFSLSSIAAVNAENCGSA